MKLHGLDAVAHATAAQPFDAAAIFGPQLAVEIGHQLLGRQGCLARQRS